MHRRAFTAALLCAFAPSAVRAAGGGEKKSGGGTTFIAFPTLTAAIIRPDGRRGVLTVEAGIDAPDKALFERAEKSKPMLRDAWNTVLAVQGARVRPGAAPDVEAIRRELQKAADRVLGRPGAVVLLGSVMVN